MAAPIPPTRRTQGERRASSHQLILDAAVESLVEDGYAGATTVTIQARAGVSRGRLLHHFPSRSALLVAAAQHLAVERLIDVETWPHADTTGPERIDRAVEQLWSTFCTTYFWAAMELWIAARNDEALRAELLPQERGLGAAIQRVVVTLFGAEHAAHPAFDDVRELLFTGMRGVALTYALDPRDPRTDPHLALWKRTARRLLATPE
ncbi:TetR/AcrR family transcriptional regulator [Pseudonocardia sp. WMMC193]|uniref:TetR/AcrR family transcriptional regulator n=1 Tax=Pseudonocardia sp. WMMC193 TaxID=2911965 RepID=UPI001F28A1B0|nr:TetR/AcrR family transcriptional regulator [Pseudonocardia sp. WMMC193]MCF7551710.1 TetR/AcrR family transcriptional regulator [Pseudonocardia sp. WMMC193]